MSVLNRPMEYKAMLLVKSNDVNGVFAKLTNVKFKLLLKSIVLSPVHCHLNIIEKEQGCYSNQYL
jgi:hypothetical protein